MLTYLRNRAHEPSTWICLVVAAGCVLLFWLFQDQIYTHIAATLALFKAAAKDGIERQALEWLRTKFTKPNLTLVEPELQENPMSDIVKSLEAAALAAFKNIPLPAPYNGLVGAVISAVENPTVPNILTAIGDIVAIAQTLEATPVPGPVTNVETAS